jgi:hypothetical protein
MVIASSGTDKRYKWVGRPKKAGNKPNTTQTISEYYGISTTRSVDYLNILSVDDIVDCANALGYDDKKIKLIRNELK